MTFWNGKKVLVTGHTGFKGSWLCLWLQKLGADVVGFALDAPTVPSLFYSANVSKNMTSIIGDIRDKNSVENLVSKRNPDIVFHMAAQALVRKSYKNPLESFETNIMGTINIFEAFRKNPCKVIVNVTSDKCYLNKEQHESYKEDAPLGGKDPYSCSKACSELISTSYRESFFKEQQIALSSARAGNVIGGGDFAEDRIIPDIIRSITNDKILDIRNPNALRPWQHVLEPLSGYMMLAESMWKNNAKFSGAWNFGPNESSIVNVVNVVSKLGKNWGKEVRVNIDNSPKPYEAQILKLDNTKAREILGWKPRLSIDESIKWTVDWYKRFNENNNMNLFTFKQIGEYEKLRGDTI